MIQKSSKFDLWEILSRNRRSNRLQKLFKVRQQRRPCQRPRHRWQVLLLLLNLHTNPSDRTIGILRRLLSDYYISIRLYSPQMILTLFLMIITILACIRRTVKSIFSIPTLTKVQSCSQHLLILIKNQHSKKISLRIELPLLTNPIQVEIISRYSNWSV